MSNDQSEGEKAMPILMTAEELALLLRVHKRVIYQWRQRGLIASIRLPGRGYRFRRADVERLLTPEPVTAQ
jgi:excisionase family DNA binding protein